MSVETLALIAAGCCWIGALIFAVIVVRQAVIIRRLAERNAVQASMIAEMRAVQRDLGAGGMSGRSEGQIAPQTQFPGKTGHASGDDYIFGA